jgi:hypothetical protein
MPARSQHDRPPVRLTYADARNAADADSRLEGADA